jgi:hypothetical protein
MRRALDLNPSGAPALADHFDAFPVREDLVGAQVRCFINACSARQYEAQCLSIFSVPRLDPLLDNPHFVGRIRSARRVTPDDLPLHGHDVLVNPIQRIQPLL